MPNLQTVSITFHTHNDARDEDTVLHVFVKNRRRSDTSTSSGATSYIANQLAYNAADTQYASPGPYEFNSYLASGINLSPGDSFDDPSTHTFTLNLRNGPQISADEIVLPVVDIHILPEEDDQWIFDYTVTFTFDNGSSFSFPSNTNGVTGIILNKADKDYSGIGPENTQNKNLPPLYPTYPSNYVLTQVLVEFATHDDPKDFDTQVGIHIVNRQSAGASQDIAVAHNVLPGADADPSARTVVFGPGGLPLSASTIRLQDIVLPVVNINIAPVGYDRWIFDYRVTFFFTNIGHSPENNAPDIRTYVSTTSGVVLDTNSHKHTGVYRGNSFPTAAPLPKPALTGPAINHLDKVDTGAKKIPLAFLEKKLTEFINSRQGQDFHSPAISLLRLHNTGSFGEALPQSYFDLKSIDSDPPPPGTPVGPDFPMGVKYSSSPVELGQFQKDKGFGDTYLNDINSQTLTLNVNRDPATGTVNRDLPLMLKVVFETDGKEVLGSFLGGMDFSEFTLTLSLSLALDPVNGKVDVMNWVEPIHAMTDDDQKTAAIGKVIHVFVNASLVDFGGSFQKTVREKIFDALRKPSPFDGTTVRDGLNATVNSWLLGGVVNNDGSASIPFANPCRVRALLVDDQNITLSYTGPQHTFDPGKPADWPANHDFTPGTLANIEHIVVLTMENRSFDHMLGYLSLPPESQGMGRTDIDGLKGHESNLLHGILCPSFAFASGDTIFSPDPPHSCEPVAHAINSGRMDGFAASYAEEHGDALGPRIMGYHTAANVPVYDALARDFAICQRWFASHPGPTFCNRFYETTGRLNIDPNGFWETSNSSPLRAVFTPTIFDHLHDSSVSWKYFEHHYCFLRFFESHTFDSANIAPFDDPEFGFAALARAGSLPSVTFIDPHFIELPPDGNCDGPPADIQAGQKLVDTVVKAVVSGAAWDKTLLVITYDEHGGFYDHVAPAQATPNSPESLATYGVRVPAFIVSPWVSGGSVFGQDARRVIGHGPPISALPDGGQALNNPPRTEAFVPPGQPATEGVPTRNAPPATPGIPQTQPGLLPGDGSVADGFLAHHFDHTSLLKTIARRFMSSNPPFLSARYAAARDLSEVVTAQPRPGPFRPYIPYTLIYGASQMALDVQGGNFGPDALLWQFTPNGTPAQQFSFEDAGGGFFYLRTHTGRHYVTANPTAQGLKQNVKYPAGGQHLGPQNPDLQRWFFSANQIAAIGTPSFGVSCAAFPGKFLQPSGGSLLSGGGLILSDPTAHHGGLGPHNPWQISSPLLPSNTQVLTH